MENARKPFTYEGEYGREISFPLGGIGAGCVGLGGNGRLTDWEIAGRPNKGGGNGYTHIAVRAVRDGKLLSALVLNGDNVAEYPGTRGATRGNVFGEGMRRDSLAGFPHFENSVFTGEFPLARVDFSDKRFPGEASLSAFGSFIPGDSENSGLPAAFFTVSLKNTDTLPADFTVAFTLHNPFDRAGLMRRVPGGDGVTLALTDTPEDDLSYGNLTLLTDAPAPGVQEAWYRGGWFDNQTVFWREFASPNPLPDRSYETPDKNDHATVHATFRLEPGEEKSVRFVLSWYVPNRENDWNPPPEGEPRRWKTYYATRFAGSYEVARYAMDNFAGLCSRTAAFHDALFSSTLPRAALDAVSANLSILVSPTVLRLEDGTFYGWEGVWEHTGSCEGSCNHVWNFAYALPFLFPDLERSMREADYKYNSWESGRMSFRVQLPLGRAPNTFFPCADGQFGGVVKTYRDWKISGDTDWLRSVWPAVKKSLDYAFSPDNEYRWDADRDGVLEGRQHDTLDMELFGPSSWLEGFYLAALKAGAEMADTLGDTVSAGEYRELYARGAAWSDENLWNGEYFTQKIDLRDKSVLTPYGEDMERVYWNAEAGELKYQIGEGCFVDQLLGQWHARLAGLGYVFSRDKTKTALQSIYRYNFRECMREFCNSCRVYAVNDEAGTVLCVYPEGKERPAISVPYSDECWSGCEYAFAAQLAMEGLTDEAERVVGAVRARYDGKRRNPWNEMECGSNYARSMASYSLIPAYSGFSFDMTTGHIGFAPKVYEDGVFRSLWAVAGAYGTVEITPGGVTLDVIEGELPLRSISLPKTDRSAAVTVDGSPVACIAEEGEYRFTGGATVRAGLKIEYGK